MWKALQVVVVFCALLGSVINAKALNGLQLYTLCRDPNNTYFKTSCDFYIQGFLSGFQAGEAVSGKKTICIPESVKTPEFRKYVVHAIEADPSLAQSDSVVVLAAAAYSVFRCPS